MSRVPRPNLYTYFLQTPVVEFGVNNLQVNTISISVMGGQGGQRQGNGSQEQGWPIANGCHLTHSPLSPPCRNRAVLPLALLNSVLQLPTHPISSQQPVASVTRRTPCPLAYLSTHMADTECLCPAGTSIPWNCDSFKSLINVPSRAAGTLNYHQRSIILNHHS